jgi:hypothetical protein
MMPECGYGSFHQQYRLNGERLHNTILDFQAVQHGL